MLTRLLKFGSTLVAIGVLLASWSAVAQTEVFNSFSSAATGVGDCIVGPDDAGCATSPISQWIAAPFVPTGSGTLDYLDVAVRYVGGTEGVVVALVNDNSGSPAPITTVLESFTVTSLPASTVAKPKKRLTSKAHPSLTGGNTYWVVIEPLGYDSESTWILGTNTTPPDFSVNGGNTWASFNTIFGGSNPPYTNLPELDVYVQ